MFRTTKLNENLLLSNDIISSGTQTLENLRIQNDMIRASHGRLYDIGIVLGLSRSTMRWIEKHIFNDKMLVIMFTIIIIVVFIILIILF